MSSVLSLLKLRLLFLHSALKKKDTAPTSWSVSALTLTHVLSYSIFALGGDGINIAVTIVTHLELKQSDFLNSYLSQKM